MSETASRRRDARALASSLAGLWVSAARSIRDPALEAVKKQKGVAAAVRLKPSNRSHGVGVGGFYG
jgi:hypothetical protein